jgi:hypothetical protein
MHGMAAAFSTKGAGHHLLLIIIIIGNKTIIAVCGSIWAMGFGFY